VTLAEHEVGVVDFTLYRTGLSTGDPLLQGPARAASWTLKCEGDG
jgi:hypothetical protein